jgi:3-deoxy-7-phosphoheptulonate synthase
MGSRLGGVHFELTGENVTECTGGPQKLLEKDLPLRYTTYCDPRLNYAQGMELAFLIAQYLADERAQAGSKARASLAPGRGLSPHLSPAKAPALPPASIAPL